MSRASKSSGGLTHCPGRQAQIWINTKGTSCRRLAEVLQGQPIRPTFLCTFPKNSQHSCSQRTTRLHQKSFRKSTACYVLACEVEVQHPAFGTASLSGLKRCHCLKSTCSASTNTSVARRVGRAQANWSSTAQIFGSAGRHVSFSKLSKTLLAEAEHDMTAFPCEQPG